MSVTVQRGRGFDQTVILNREILADQWADLNLPARCRAIWEAEFPELAERSPSGAS